MKRWLPAVALVVMATGFLPYPGGPGLRVTKRYGIDSLGACQGISNQQGRYFLYGDREVGVIREYRLGDDSLQYTGREMRLTLNDTDVINHPTGLAFRKDYPVFIGNSIRLNKEGTQWRAVIYHIDWPGLQRTGTLDNNLLNTIEDDACIQGTRPEYVRYKNKWLVATADYGNKNNEVRLYDPALLKTAKKTSEPGIVVKKFNCSPWVQNLHWIDDQGWLVLIQNQVEGRKWRFTYIDLEKSVETGKAVVIKVFDTDDPDELEGFTIATDPNLGIAVSSSRRQNVAHLRLDW